MATLIQPSFQKSLSHEVLEIKKVLEVGEKKVKKGEVLCTSMIYLNYFFLPKVMKSMA